MSAEPFGIERRYAPRTDRVEQMKQARRDAGDRFASGGERLDPDVLRIGLFSGIATNSALARSRWSRQRPQTHSAQPLLSEANAHPAVRLDALDPLKLGRVDDLDQLPVVGCARGPDAAVLDPRNASPVSEIPGAGFPSAPESLPVLVRTTPLLSVHTTTPSSDISGRSVKPRLLRDRRQVRATGDPDRVAAYTLVRIIALIGQRVEPGGSWLFRLPQPIAAPNDTSLYP